KKLFIQKAFNKKERELWKLLPNVNHGDPDTLEWVSLIGQLKQVMDQGIHVPAVQRIVKRMEDKQQETFKGEEQFVQKLWEIRKSPEQSQEAGLYPIAKDVLDFLEKASDLYRQSKTKNDPDPDGIDHSLM